MGGLNERDAGLQALPPKYSRRDFVRIPMTHATQARVLTVRSQLRHNHTFPVTLPILGPMHERGHGCCTAVGHSAPATKSPHVLLTSESRRSTDLEILVLAVNGSSALFSDLKIGFQRHGLRHRPLNRA